MYMVFCFPRKRSKNRQNVSLAVHRPLCDRGSTLIWPFQDATVHLTIVNERLNDGRSTQICFVWVLCVKDIIWKKRSLGNEIVTKKKTGCHNELQELVSLPDVPGPQSSSSNTITIIAFIDSPHSYAIDDNNHFYLKF